MKIRSLSITNFRAYKNTTQIFFDDLTVFVGKNDVGKSTILEALDIFFHDGKKVVLVMRILLFLLFLMICLNKLLLMRLQIRL